MFKTEQCLNENARMAIRIDDKTSCGGVAEWLIQSSLDD